MSQVDSVGLSTQKLFSLPKSNWMELLAKKFVLRFLGTLKKGHLVLEDGDERYTFGQARGDSDINAHIEVLDSSAYVDLMLHGSTGSGEAYIRRAWTSPDLLSVIRFFVTNIDQLNDMDNDRPWLLRVAMQIGHKLNANSRKRAKENISAHYDLGNDFFKVFLDPTMMYSAAIFATPDTTLEDAAVAKLDAICKKLQLKPADHLLEIGTGWGGMAIHAASHYGCRVTTTTISREQFEFTRSKVKVLGLDDKITVLLEDYRDLSGRYDKLVSIEMIEAVGHEYYREYFSKCNSLLKANGLMLIQAITIPCQRFDIAKDSVDFIKKYIFPGGCLPSVAEIANNCRRYTDMVLVQMDEIGEHYARTLAEWHTRFERNLHDIKAQGFDDKFCRMWEFYLKYCEGGFQERVIGTGQLLLAKPGARNL
ncbi:SAM-dependent methyltransferase [Teredinibacter turnerae]|uniref:SAM-dependent methyltransferase n=1 Tax=Teredinibacter turnerae TaxID=2426 RepID=UPI0003706062|nr:cyclopropane-fatty-acyl-phospholipid synthase family protein [Teredinibacter turnerae]